jgi:hypothetical protein
MLSGCFLLEAPLAAKVLSIRFRMYGTDDVKAVRNQRPFTYQFSKTTQNKRRGGPDRRARAEHPCCGGKKTVTVRHGGRVPQRDNIPVYKFCFRSY